MRSLVLNETTFIIFNIHCGYINNNASLPIQLQQAHLRVQTASEYHPPNAPTTQGTPAKTSQKINTHEYHSGQLRNSKSLGLVILVSIFILPILGIILYGQLGFRSFFLSRSFLPALIIRSTLEIISCCMSSACKPANIVKKHKQNIRVH
jgi:hypothetical protein